VQLAQTCVDAFVAFLVSSGQCSVIITQVLKVYIQVTTQLLVTTNQQVSFVPGG
jgi:hypothetical protein